MTTALSLNEINAAMSALGAVTECSIGCYRVAIGKRYAEWESVTIENHVGSITVGLASGRILSDGYYTLASAPSLSHPWMNTYVSTEILAKAIRKLKSR